MAGKAGRRGWGSLRRLKSKRWRASYNGPDGLRYAAPRTFAAKIDAEAYLVEQHRQIERGTWKPPHPVDDDEAGKPKILTFESYADTWLKTRRNRKGEPLRPRTSEHYRDLLDRFILPTFGALPLDSVAPTQVRRWFGTMDKTPTYRARAYGLLKAILATAHEDGHIEANPCVVRGGGQVDRKVKIEPASLEDLAVLVENMPDRLRLMVLLASWCGLRFGELVELRRKDVLREGVLKVRRGAVRAGGQVIVGNPKTSAGSRDVHIPPHLLPTVEDHLRRHVERGRDALLFPASGGGTLAPASLYRHYYKARKAAGRPDLRFHDLRHTGAVLAAQSGATLAELMLRLGHSTPGAAMRYQHVAAGRDAEIAARLSAMVAPPPAAR